MLPALAFAQSTIKGSQVVVTGSGSIYVFVATSVNVLPGTVGTSVGSTTQFTGQFVDNLGNTAPACASSGWASSNAGIATVSSTGLATGVSQGTATISCTDSALTGNASLIVETAPVFTNPPTPCTQPCALVGGTVSQLYSFALSVTGGTAPYNFTLTAGSLPLGLNLSSGGVISGTPASTGNSIFSVQPCDSLGACSTALQMSIQILGAGPSGPLTWVDSHEMDGGQTAHTIDIVTDLTVNFPASGTGGSWTCNVTNYGPYTANSTASLQQAYNDIEHCRTQNNKSVKLIRPAGSVFSSASTLIIPQSSTVLATKPLIVVTSNSLNLPEGTTVCVKGIQDNLATSTDIFIDNPDCTGTNMYYVLGTTQTNIPVGAFTLANGTVTNTSAYNDVANLSAIEITALNQSAVATCIPSALTSSTPCESATLAPDHWIFDGEEIRMKPGIKSNANIVQIGDLSSNPTSTSQLPTHIHRRHDWVHGDWLTLQTGANSVSTAIHLTCVYCSEEDGYISESLRPGAEGHSFYTGYGTTQKIVHNVFEGSSIGFFCGGFSTQITIPNYTSCSDMQIGRNRMTFPIAWIGNSPITGNPNWSGSFDRKNPAEWKIGQRVVVYGSIFENSDNSGGQRGVLGPQINPRACSTVPCGNYNTTINDFFVYGNIYRNGCEGMTFSNASVYGNSGNGVTFTVARSSIMNNLWMNVSTANPGCTGSGHVGLSMASSNNNWQVSITRDATGTIATATLVCSNMLAGNCPAGPPPLGLAQSDFRVGDPVSVYGCTNTSFNNPANPNFALPSTALGQAAQPGTLTNGLTVVFNSTGTPNSSDTSLTCTLSKIQGYPLNFVLDHNTEIADSAAIAFDHGPLVQGAYLALNGLVRDNILCCAGWQSSTTEGTKTENFGFDTSSLTNDHNVWPTRTASKYTEYGNNSGFPDSAGCTVAGCNPPVTEAFPTTAYCTGGSSDPTCIGFVGGMNLPLGPMPIIFNDYHSAALRSDSSFHNTASDGTDRGVNVPLLDTLQTQNPFVCPAQLSCSSSPFPD